MQHSWPSRCAALALVGCLTHVSGQAATIGRAQGAVLIGRPLEVSVPVVLEGSVESVPDCAQAEVFYGDTKVPAGSVSTDLQMAASGPTVRVRAGSAINEPVVIVYLRVGCGNRFTRRLVLLAEPDPAVEVQRPVPAVGTTARAEAAEAAVNAAPLNLSMSRDVPRLAPAPAPVPAQHPRRRRPSASASTTAKPGTPAAPAPVMKPSATPSAQKAVQAPATPAPRDQLKLDVPVGTADPTAPSEEQIRQAARLQAIERDLRDMRQFLQRSDAAMLQLQAQLAKAESERYANPLVYALAALLVAMAVVMAVLWRRASAARQEGSEDWWRTAVDERSSGPASVADATGREVDTHEASRHAAAPPANTMSFSVDSELAAAAPVPPTVRVPLASVSARTDDFLSSQGSSRALKAEELHDVQQEADFFSSLGEYDRAIEVLRSHIQAHPETSAVAWLDLVEIYHKLGRREEFDWVRREFQRRFNADVPAFDEYSQESAGIEAYDNAMARIAALWPSRRVLDVIEESIFRGPSKDGTQAFSLQAYRELLLLHHIGQQVLVGSATPPSVFGDSGPISSSSHGFSHTSIHPLSTGIAALDDSQGAAAPTELQSEFALDLNLDEPPPPAPAAARDEHLLDFDLPDLAQSPAQARARR